MRHPLVATLGASLVLMTAAQGLRADGPPPAINVSEICTTCKDVIRCSRDPASPAPASSPVVVYYLHEESTWDQVATIWEYFIRFGKPKTTNVRELSIYDLPGETGAPTRIQDALEATLDATTMTIQLPGGARIDRTTGAWLLAGPDGSAVPAGACRLLTPAAGGEFLRSLPTANQP